MSHFEFMCAMHVFCVMGPVMDATIYYKCEPQKLESNNFSKTVVFNDL